MGASEKSEKLGLSLWQATDRPERMDFYTDNEQLENIVGGHIADEALHMTADRKGFLKQPYKIVIYTGTGDKQYSQIAPFVPSAVFVLCADMPPSVERSDGGYDIYWDFWVREGTGSYCGMGGVGMLNPASTTDRTFYRRSQSSTTNSKLFYKMNEQGKKYVAFFVKPIG